MHAFRHGLPPAAKTGEALLNVLQLLFYTGIMVDAGFQLLPAPEDPPAAPRHFRPQTAWNGKFENAWVFEYVRRALRSVRSGRSLALEQVVIALQGLKYLTNAVKPFRAGKKYIHFETLIARCLGAVVAQEAGPVMRLWGVASSG